MKIFDLELSPLWRYYKPILDSISTDICYKPFYLNKDVELILGSSTTNLEEYPHITVKNNFTKRKIFIFKLIKYDMINMSYVAYSMTADKNPEPVRPNEVNYIISVIDRYLKKKMLLSV